MGAMTTIEIPVEDGTSLPAYLASPASDQAPVGVIVAHELFGVNQEIRGVADVPGTTPGAGSWNCSRPRKARPRPKSPR